MNLPNKISIFRIILVPIIWIFLLFPYKYLNIYFPILNFSIVFIPMERLIVLLLFVLAAISDFLDGYIARKYNMISNFGKFIDPIADKLLINSLLIIFAFERTVPLICILIMISRDIIVDAIRMNLALNGQILSAGIFGKLKTVMQMIAIVVILLNNYPFELFSIPMATILIWFATFVSVFSGVKYLISSRDKLM